MKYEIIFSDTLSIIVPEEIATSNEAENRDKDGNYYYIWWNDVLAITPVLEEN